MEAYQDVLNLTSTDWAPLVRCARQPQWYRDLVISNALVQTLEDLKMEYPRTAKIWLV